MASDDPHLELPWNPFSEQPQVIKRRRFVQRLRHSFGDYFKAGLVFMLFLPLVCAHHTMFAIGRMPAGWRQRGKDPREFMGLAVALHSCEPEELVRQIEELGVKHLLLRIPVWEITVIDRYVNFIHSLPHREVVVCIMQDRVHVKDMTKWRSSLRTIVDACWPQVKAYQIGQGPNRSKWGFFSGTEYLEFAAEAELLRASHPGIRLIGPGILDFETIPLLRFLIHGYPVRWDSVACALYVDRRGSLRNKQLGIFDLKNKIRHFAGCIASSRKSERRFWITEVNWPIRNQGRYSPVRERECVSEEDAGQYLREYCEDAWETRLVERVYWWPGATA